MNSTKCVRVDIKNSYNNCLHTPALECSLIKMIQLSSEALAEWCERRMHQMRPSAEVNPGIQHIPADLLQTKSQPAIFSFYDLLEVLGV